MQVFEKIASRVRRNQLQFTPDGRSLAVGAFPFLLLDTTDGSCRTFPEVGKGWWGWALIRNGGAVALLPGGKILTVFDFDKREPQIVTTEAEGRGIAANPNGEKLYLNLGAHYEKEGAHIGVFNTTDFKQEAEFIPVIEPLYQLCISADGNWLAASHHSNSLRAWHITKEKLASRASMCVTAYKLNHFALSADGAHLAAARSYGLTIWKTKNGEEVVHSGKHKRSVTAVACNPVKPILATGDNAGQVFLWDYTGNVLTRYDWKLGDIFGLTFAPDGLRCAAVDNAGKVVVWDIDV